ncbi:polysaccharide deacetylase family protein [Bacillus spongiae]|uniref:Polysaccharide deacetylase family protein n=1 Tax=Bacillus spongiae TaxID=2683610 RepID=A0ABU8HIC6_9BACI
MDMDKDKQGTRKKRSRSRLRHNRIVLAGMMVLLLIFSVSWILDSGEAKISNGKAAQKEEFTKERVDSVVKESSTEATVEKDDNQTDLETNDDEANTNREEDSMVSNSSEDIEDTNVEEPPVMENEKTVYITFDDGPNENTEAILEILEQYGAKATFFMVEPNMRKYSQAVKSIVAEGHSVGLHGVTHDVNKFYQSSKSAINEMLTAQSTLESITGVHSKLIRVPYGSVPNMKPEYFEAVDKEGFRLWDWNVDSEDWKFNSGEYIQNVMDQLSSFTSEKQQKVILLHEKQTTLAHLELLLQNLTKQGYRMRALTEQMKPLTFR